MFDPFIKNILNENVEQQYIKAKKLTPKFVNASKKNDKVNKSFIYNGKEYTRLLIMGDIHGMYDKLLDALSKVHITDDDLLITLGDYTDRGSQNVKCEQAIINFAAQDNIINLLGNHDRMLLDHFIYITHHIMKEVITLDNIDNISEEKWIGIINHMKNYFYPENIYTSNGGNTTLSELSLDTLDIFKEYLKTILTFPAKFQLSINNNNYIFVHAGIDPNKSIDEQDISDLIWIRDKFYDYYTGDDIICIGHTPTPFLFCDIVPHWEYNIVFTDTGSFWHHGKITIIDLLSHEYWQSKEG